MGTRTDNCSNDPTSQTADRVNSWGQLPIIDPDYLVVERLAGWLHAYVT